MTRYCVGDVAGELGPVKRAVQAINQRDIDGYLACCTEDVQLVTPAAGVGGTYDGPDGIRRFFADLADATPDFALAIERLQAVSDCLAAAWAIHKQPPRSTSKTSRNCSGVSRDAGPAAPLLNSMLSPFRSRGRGTGVALLTDPDGCEGRSSRPLRPTRPVRSATDRHRRHRLRSTLNERKP